MRRRRSSTSIRARKAIRTTPCRGPRTASCTSATRHWPTRRRACISWDVSPRTSTTTWTRWWRRRSPCSAGSREPMSAALELWAGLECTVNRVGGRHFDQLARSGHDERPGDLDLVAQLGVRRLRYPVLWERADRNWKRTDERLTRLRELGVEPIVGLVHHGSGPLGTSLVDDTFTTGLAEHAARVAERYPWVRDWTPVNEPLTTARFSALYGHWYPHARDDSSFGLALEHELRATVLAMAAIRSVVPNARLVQTEDVGRTHATPAIAYQAALENERRGLPWDLLCGRANAAAARYGIDVEWFAARPCPPDILGVNH